VTASYDVAIIGGGPGGYATAIRAAGHGLRAAIVEADKAGGTCLHRGCVPSKALLHVGALADAAPQLVAMGLAPSTTPVDVIAAGELRDGIVDRLHRGLEGLLKSAGVEVIAGRGTMTPARELLVDGRAVPAQHVVIATGSVPSVPPGWTPDGTRVLTSDDALRLAQVPRRGVVIGAGAIGVELASLWRSLGSEVTLIDAADRIVPLEDEALSSWLTKAFRKRGITVVTGLGISRLEVDADQAVVTLADGTRLPADQALVAVGRRAATAGLGLEELDVLEPDGHVATNAHGATSVQGLWAVGDVRPTLALAHAAFAEGFVVADCIAGLEPEPVDHAQIPRVTYCTPELASVGLTEEEARRRHGDGVRATATGLAGNARSLIEGESGLVKLVTGPDGTLLGGHLAGPSASELIAEIGLATSWEALAAEVGAVAHAHPSLAEGVREAALLAAGTPFHAHR
jgi:dihydrolipoamide dehydrogenase